MIKLIVSRGRKTNDNIRPTKLDDLYYVVRLHQYELSTKFDPMALGF